MQYLREEYFGKWEDTSSSRRTSYRTKEDRNQSIDILYGFQSHFTKANTVTALIGFEELNCSKEGVNE